MLLTLPDELLLNVIKFLTETKYHFNLRSVNKKLYKFYDRVPFYKDKEHLANIYISPTFISWRSVKKEQKLMKEIIFGNYGKININTYDKKNFKTKDNIVYELPNSIKKYNYENRCLITNTFDVKNYKIETKSIPLMAHPCTIS